MTIFNYFVLGLGYGACALGIILMVLVAIMLPAAIIGALTKHDDDRGDGDGVGWR